MQTVSPQLVEAIDRALVACGRAMGDFVGLPTTMCSREIALEAVLQVPSHYDDLEDVCAAAYVGMTGDVSGHGLLFMSEETAQALIRVAEEGLGPLDAELAQSLLNEFGNIAVSAFMNGLATAGGWRILPTPPEVTWTGLGAALQSLVGAIALESDLALIVAAKWVLGGRDLDCGVLVLPDARGLTTILGHESHDHAG